MKRIIALILGAAVLPALWFTGCSVDTPDSPQLAVTPPVGDARLANYVAIGSGLTAGFMDAGLHINGQLSAYPRLLALRMGHNAAPAANATWTMPYIADPGIGNTSTGDPTQIAGVLHWNGSAIALAGVTPAAQVPALSLFAALPLPYHNLGVPGATMLDVGQALGSGTSQSPGNAFFDLILRNPVFGNVTMRDQCIGKRPTLVTLWVGDSDILGGVLGGNPAVGVNITPPSIFGSLFANLLDAVAAGVTARVGYAPVIVAANLPNLLHTPYFVPKALFDSVVGMTVETVETDPVYVRFPALAYLQGGGTLPLPGTWTLTGDEVQQVEIAVDGYNSAIASACAARDATLVDAHALYEQLRTSGIGTMTANHFLFIRSQHPDWPVAMVAAATAFSLDGLHLNNRGQAALANAFIDRVNAALGTALPPLDLNTISWDPTYGRPPVAAAEPGASLTAEAAAAMEALAAR